MSNSELPLLRLERLGVLFSVNGRPVPAVRQLRLDIPAGKVVCLVGESGCGKSLTARAILRLPPENARLEGAVLFRGRNLLSLTEKELCRIRGRHIGMVFQEPMTALNPVLRVGEQVAEALRQHLHQTAREARAETERLFSAVGIPSAHARYDAYPHQLSGGLRQRVMIAMALCCGPELLLADEPTTALDATMQAQILSLILRQSRERGMAVLLITHDLGLVGRIADLIGVMYAGCLVELAPAAALLRAPGHPYTRGLIFSAPSRLAAGAKRLPTIPGSVPDLRQMPEGCPFAPRCQLTLPRCHESLPPLEDTGERLIRCWRRAA